MIISEKGELLLGVRGIEPEKGKLDLPGGFLQLGEHPFDGAKREAKEELGVDIEIVRVLGFVMDTYGPGGDATLNIALQAKIIRGVCAPADDVAELIWVDPKTQTASPLAFSNNEKIIRMYLASLGE